MSGDSQSPARAPGHVGSTTGPSETQALRARVAELEQQLDGLAVVKRRFESLFEQSGDGITLADIETLAFVESNEQMTRLFGFSREEMLALKIDDLDLGFSSEASARRKADDIRRGREHTFETEYRCKDGTIKPVEITVRILHIDGHAYSQAVVRDISARRQAETLQRDSHDRFKDFAETASDRFWETDAAHRYVFLSPSRHHWAAAARTLLGKRPWEAIDGRSPVDPDRLRSLHESRESFRSEHVTWTARDGEATHTLVSGTPVTAADGTFLGHRGTYIDVTAELNASGNTGRTQRQVYQAMNEMATGIVVWDDADRLILCNEEFRRRHAPIADLLAPGVDYETVLRAIATRSDPPVPPPDRDAWIASRVAIHHEDRSETEEQRDGRWYLIAKQRLRDGGVLAVHTDITERKRTTSELHAAQLEVVKSERWAALGRLIGTVAHELRNPLATIAQSVHVLDSRTRGHGLGAEKLSDRIRRSLERCERIVVELLEFGREQRLSLRAVGLDAWLREHFAEHGPRDGVSLELALEAGDSDARVALDDERFRRVVINLVDNACDAIVDAARDDGVVRVSTRRTDDGQAELTICDNGQGLTDEVLTSAFEPLFSTKQTGFGLGLPTVRRIVERHGGMVDLVRGDEQGACARLVLPLAPSD